MDVSSYTEEFHRLCLKSKTVEGNTEKVARYLNGLRVSIQDELNLCNPKTIQKCYQLALNVKEKLKRRQDQNNRGRGKKDFNNRGKGMSTGRGQNFRPQGEPNQENSQGESSSRGGYRGRRSNSRGRFGGRNGGPMRCFNCNQTGHHADRCLEKTGSNTQGDRRTNLIQEDAQSSQSPSKDLDLEGVCLMTKRMFLKTPAPREPPQRKTLFRTKCKSHSKVFRLVVDFGSTENLVSKEMVDKLKFVKLPHPNPSHLSWPSKGEQTLINEQASVDFSIGEYTDRILCDVVDMNVCHLLLGCPWQYDLKAQHDGMKNTNTINKDGNVNTMKPLPDLRNEKQNEPMVLLVGEREMVETIEEAEGAYALILKPKEQENPKEVPREVQELIDINKGVVAGDLSDALPPLRDVCHHIDFIPCASLPKKEAYKLTPAQAAEVARQVHDLLDKGLIQKSKSPCAVPSVLAPKKDGKWRLCTDSRGVNKITIRYRFPIPRIEDLMDHIGGAYYFSKIRL
ncbi:uncharacterized protein LOC131051562 [Cryptomeria japonica]|uniref:uncharacterized protein LOC131051562 n=1 Tax=Cryptomeria japonica TaxID=3369 RepID=UPI0027DA57FC|nr:uncharacterized protein LOC131051562 [Cryptomeria japonica]